MIEKNTPVLTSPRYVPYTIVDASMAAWYDCQADQYVVLCPECHMLIAYDTPEELYLEMVWRDQQCCQGCRARALFACNPHLVGEVLEVWLQTRTFPQSPSWVEAIPRYQCTMWAGEIEAGLEAATAAMIGFPSTSAKGARTRAI
jgi:N-acyl-L-homoserine lactone synthetase